VASYVCGPISPDLRGSVARWHVKKSLTPRRARRRLDSGGLVRTVDKIGHGAGEIRLMAFAASVAAVRDIQGGKVENPDPAILVW